jgi:hypothetical protein
MICIDMITSRVRMRRTMSGNELDDAIRSVLAYQALARERWRRKDWQRREENAAKFKEQFAALQAQVGRWQ